MRSIPGYSSTIGGGLPVRVRTTSPRVYYLGSLVVKKAKLHPVERELLEVSSTFLTPRWSWRDYLVMDRGQPATLGEARAAMMALKSSIWTRPGPRRSRWRLDLLFHIGRVYKSPRLLERVAELPKVESHRMVHGDSTVANLLWVHSTLRWIDPLYRDYVPGHPAVDVGKFWQSCWNYENVVRGQAPFFDFDNAREVARACGVSETDAETWLLVHLARLLRYHEPRVQHAFREVLEDHYECRL